MKLTILTWITFFLLAIVMGLNNIYSTLLTGWGEGGSIVAVILCLIFLSKKQRNIVNYNLGQTMASAGGSVGFSVAMIAAIYYIFQQEGSQWRPPLFNLSLLVMAFSVMGVTLAVIFRNVIVKWLFPQAMACATILRAVTSDNHSERQQAQKIMGISGVLSAALTIPAKVAFQPGAPALWSKLTITNQLGVSLDPLLYGIGNVVGGRIGVSLLLGGLFNVLLLTPNLQAKGLEVGEYTRWVAVGLMTLPAFTSALFTFMMKKERPTPIGFTPIENDPNRKLSMAETTGLWFLFLVATFIVAYEMDYIFNVTWYYVVAGIAISGPMCFALGKVTSEIGINPIRLLAIVLLFLFSIFERHEPIALLAISVSGATYAAVAVDLFNDLRTGYLIRANPKHQILLQILGVIPVAFVCVYFLDFLTVNFGLGEGQYFPAPTAVIWATMANAFSGETGALSHGIWLAIFISTIVGVFLSFLESNKRTQAYTPSAFALGIAMLLPFEMSAAIFVGSVFREAAIFIGKLQGHEQEEAVRKGAFKAGSAIFAASSIAGIIAVILISLGVVYLPS
ncbi:MAG: OPT/YSL family transporter [Chlamydiota bacterium]